MAPGTRHTTIVDHLRAQELEPGASGDEVRAAFRRLARRYHPDLDRTRRGQQRFVQVVQAYRALQMELGLHPDPTRYRLCPGCGHYAELLDGLDGRAGCTECLLGFTQRGRYLPLPIVISVRHVAGRI